jgi:hypothetical protein
VLWDEHEAWFEGVLDAMEGVPLLVFCHFPLVAAAMDEIRYYEPGRKPCYVPRPGVRTRLSRRKLPTFWFSGHVHFRPPHALSVPYLTEDRVWQIHCPDSWGFGRSDNDNWRPQHYDGLFVKTLHLDRQYLCVVTTDLTRNLELSAHRFALWTGRRDQECALHAETPR